MFIIAPEGPKLKKNKFDCGLGRTEDAGLAPCPKVEVEIADIQSGGSGI
jgi:hypothetical protein